MRVEINYATHRAHVAWDARRVKLSRDPAGDPRHRLRRLPLRPAAPGRARAARAQQRAVAAVRGRLRRDAGDDVRLPGLPRRRRRHAQRGERAADALGEPRAHHAGDAVLVPAVLRRRLGRAQAPPHRPRHADRARPRGRLRRERLGDLQPGAARCTSIRSPCWCSSCSARASSRPPRGGARRASWIIFRAGCRRSRCACAIRPTPRASSASPRTSSRRATGCWCRRASGFRPTAWSSAATRAPTNRC